MEQDWKYIKKYNFVFSLGAACTCTDMIRRMKLQDYSYPFDWVWGSSFVERFNYLIQNFDGYFDKNDFELVHLTSDTHHAVWRNRRTGIVYNHDFADNQKDINASFNMVRRKYNRRFKRLLSFIKSSRYVAIIWLERPNKQDKTATIAELKECLEKLQHQYKKKIFHIHYIHQVDGIDEPQCKCINNIYFYDYDYRYKNGQFDWMVDFGRLWSIFRYIKYKRCRKIRLYRRIDFIKSTIKIMFQALKLKNIKQGLKFFRGELKKLNEKYNL